MQSRSRYSCHTLFLVLYAITMQIISLIHYTPLIQVKYPFISLNFGSGDGEFVGWQGTDGSSSVFSLVSSTSLFLSSSQCVVVVFLISFRFQLVLYSWGLLTIYFCYSIFLKILILPLVFQHDIGWSRIIWIINVQLDIVHSIVDKLGILNWSWSHVWFWLFSSEPRLDYVKWVCFVSFCFHFCSVLAWVAFELDLILLASLVVTCLVVCLPVGASRL